MAEILTSVFFEQWTGNRFQLHFALKKSPRVVALLGGRKIFALSYIRLVDKIRMDLNPYTTDESLLMYVILDFETWLNLEERVQPKLRGPGKDSSRRVNRAIALAKSGKRQVEIARELGVGESTVSSWTKKHDAFAVALSMPRNTARP